QSQSQATMLSGNRAIGLLETIKYEGQEFGANAFTSVGHGQLRHAISPLNLDSYIPAFRRKLNAVRQQVPDDLLQPLGISLYCIRRWVKCDLQLNSLGVGSRLY